MGYALFAVASTTAPAQPLPLCCCSPFQQVFEHRPSQLVRVEQRDESLPALVDAQSDQSPTVHLIPCLDLLSPRLLLSVSSPPVISRVGVRRTHLASSNPGKEPDIMRCMKGACAATCPSPTLTNGKSHSYQSTTEHLSSANTSKALPQKTSSVAFLLFAEHMRQQRPHTRIQ
eukprot:GFKZ01012136.1.p2 GENE.GFKZ01012136.1~~GFKZ01012136.1.p2  ORF type:complete len:173 (-),score=1.37 GFKZ01012136.1:877-1395(-)